MNVEQEPEIKAEIKEGLTVKERLDSLEKEYDKKL